MATVGAFPGRQENHSGLDQMQLSHAEEQPHQEESSEGKDPRFISPFVSPITLFAPGNLCPSPWTCSSCF